MTGMLGHPVAENPIDLMFDAVYAHYGLPWQFWKNDIATEADLALAVKAQVPLGYRGKGITVPWKVAVPAGTTMLMNATHLGCAPELEPVPVRWDTVDPTCPVVDGVEMLVQLAMQIFQRWTGVTPEEAVFQRTVAAALGE
jgi:shikimate 5-dehydrogenase